MAAEMEDPLCKTFLLEADDLLAEIEAAALAMSGPDAGADSVNQIFRMLHTIKGSGAMTGFDSVAAFTHHVESLLDQVREGVVPVSEDLASLILSATDHIRSLLEAAQGGRMVNPSSESKLVERLHRLSAASASSRQNEQPKRWKIIFRPDRALLSRGVSPLHLFRDLKKLGECRIEGHTDRLPALAEMRAGECYLWWTIHLTSEASADCIREAFLFAEGSELLVEPDEGPVVQPSAVICAHEPEISGTPPHLREAIVRVPVAKLDRLVTLVGELVSNQSRLATAAARLRLSELAAPVEESERLISELRDDVLQIRMTPIGTIFGQFRRLVHDLSRQLGKEIDLVTAGEQTELDEGILHKLGELLVHLLRNSIDHGIESADVRLAKDKPRCGTIRLEASHRGSSIVVAVKDDGAGLNRVAIRAKAVARRMIAPDAVLSDQELLDLILLPGFSTAQSVTSVSGRGVGMDAVKRQIDDLHGHIDVKSEAGTGTCIFLTLPLTLAMVDGLLVETGTSTFIIPMAAVRENADLLLAERARNNGRHLVAIRGELIPYVDLREEFKMDDAMTDKSIPALSRIVIVAHDGRSIGIVVDRVLGVQRAVIQSLGKVLSNVEVVSGATMMGDGSVALILDVSALVRLADRRQGHEARFPPPLPAFSGGPSSRLQSIGEN